MKSQSIRFLLFSQVSQCYLKFLTMLNSKPTSLNPFASKILIQPKNALSDYVCSWLKDQKIREDLTKRIKYKKQTDNQKLINDETLTEEYFKIWMEQPNDKLLMKLAMHPLLTLENQKQIDQMSINERNDQIKLSAQLTAGTVGFYWLFLSRMAKFQRFFNDRNKNRFINGFKKFMGVYVVLLAWQTSLTSHYEKMLPQKIHEKGLFKKYGIEFENKDV